MSAAKRIAPGAEVAGAVTLALAFYRAPASHADLLHGIKPLPESLGGLLRLAAGTAAKDVSPEIVSLAPPRDLKMAARFFIEQVLFRHDAHYFRVLGVNPGASIDQIKEHHRLLMRLFHPDRETLGVTDENDWNETYATRVNLAYNTLRDADSRSRYLATLKSQVLRPPASATPVPRVMPRRMAPEPDSFWALHLEPVFKRYLPQWVLGGTALLASVLVAAVYLSNPPVEVAQVDVAAAGMPKPQVADRSNTMSTSHPVIELAKEQAERLEAAIARFERRESETMMPLVPNRSQPPVETRPNQQQALPSPLPSPPVRPTVWVAKSVAYSPPQPAAAMPSPGIRQNTAPVMTETKPVFAPSVVAPTVTQAAMQSVPAPQPMADPMPVPWNPNVLLAQLAEAYERGDTQDLMSMFDETVRTSAGSRIETQRDYEDLFRSTDLRYLKLDNMVWNGEGEILKGQGKYRMTQMRKGETILKTQSGSVRIDLVRRGRSVLVAAFYLAPGR